MVMLAIGILFANSIPVTVPYAAMYFFFQHFSDRHQILYYYNVVNMRTDGVIHVNVWRYVLFLMTGLQLATVGNLSAKFAPIQAGIALVIAFINAFPVRHWLNDRIKKLRQQENVVELFEDERVEVMGEEYMMTFHHPDTYKHPGLKPIEHRVKKKWKKLRSEHFESLKEGLKAPGGLATLGSGLKNAASAIPKPHLKHSESKETLVLQELEEGKGKGKVVSMKEE
eukprot:TRINITY_DN1618_c1_g1_i3.p1 TRINITY_DN1618_c1_g1~~TRINITY_DN1618_c1_g1_i3.p1  ORF type:complete len:226 (-),score=64.69 TRINITY_DN1618_c1_g1_i3:139-816(-)